MLELVDDRDPRVVFEPQDSWILAGGKGEFSQTTHGTRTSNATMTFRFNGTYIEVRGTNPKLAESPVSPVTVFTIDDGTPVYYAPRILETAVQHQKMFASANLMDGEHELRMVNTEANGKVWVDYLAFIPGKAEKRVLVDDSDQRVSYSPENAWFRSGIPEEYNGTTHGTNTTNAEMVFSFEGTYIEVYGTLQSGSEVSVVFSVDDGSPFNYTRNVTETLIRQKLFSSNLTDGEHELRVMNTREGGVIFLDYLAYVPSEGGSPSVRSTPEPSASSSGLNPVAIAGIAVASLVVFVVVGFLVWWWRFRGRINGHWKVARRRQMNLKPDPYHLQFPSNLFSPVRGSPGSPTAPSSRLTWPRDDDSLTATWTAPSERAKYGEADLNPRLYGS
ncbi:hypothetical protein VNI00_009776 [Paramarasmius palmivorus]|uniref:Transmembrane protein n=1 Tax=Paramarasmius palmivorus TaxID=297713 RepID=A0AAW0CNE1_9AGAR